MLVLRAKYNEIIKLTDLKSGTIITVKLFIRDNGDAALAFDAPKKVIISREGNPKNERH